MPTTPASDTLPGLPNGEPPQPVVRTRAVRPTSEYVSGGDNAWLAAWVRSLPPHIDDVTRDLGADLYEQMLIDDQVFSSVRTVNLGVLEDGYQLRPAVDDKDDARYDGAKRWLRFCERCLDGLPSDNGFEAWLEDMLLATGLGHRLAEWTARKEEAGRDAGKLVLRCLKVKPRRTYALVVDVYRNLVGFLGLIPGQAAPVMAGTILAGGQRGWILPRDKFCVLSNAPRDGDPRGTSILRAAYTPWLAKRELWVRYLAYLAQFASPSLVGHTPENAQAATALDADGNPAGQTPTSPEQAMLNQILTFQNGSAIVLPSGADLQALHVPGGDGPFHAALDRCDRAIAKAITLQTLATEEGRHQARAAAEVHQDTGGLSPRQLKQALARMVSKDLLYRLVLANTTPAEARELAPVCTFSPTAQQDWTATAQVAASIGYQLDASQLPAMDERLGLPPRQSPEMQPGMEGTAQQPGASAGRDSRPGRDAPAKSEAKPGQAGRISPGVEGPPKGEEAGFAWDESEHPRLPAGSAGGGEFAPAGGAAPTKPASAAGGRRRPKADDPVHSYLDAFVSPGPDDPPATAEDARAANRELRGEGSSFRVVPDGKGGWDAWHVADLKDQYGSAWVVSTDPLTGLPDVAEPDYFEERRKLSGDEETRGYLHAFNDPTAEPATAEDAATANRELADSGSRFRLAHDAERGLWVAQKATRGRRKPSGPTEAPA